MPATGVAQPSESNGGLRRRGVGSQDLARGGEGHCLHGSTFVYVAETLTIGIRALDLEASHQLHVGNLDPGV